MLSKNGRTKQKNDKINQDICFAYENFLMLRNLFFFGVCDGHGSCGQFASEHAKIYIPANFQYLEIISGLEKNKKTLDEFMKILLTSNEKSDVKNMNIIKYFYNKIGINFPNSNSSFGVKKSLKEIRGIITDVFRKTHDDLLDKEFDYDYSGTTVCGVFISGRSVYCANLGDSRAVIGSFNEVIYTYYIF
jgi:serine/threonine protein phosphatase PrpC